MTRYAFFTHVLFGTGLFFLSCVVCWLMISKIRILDIPNHRSSHDVPTPKSGGIVIVITFTIGVMVIYFFGDDTLIRGKYFLGFFFSALLIASVSFYDDLTNKPFLFKFFSQLIAVITVMTFGIVITELDLPWFGNTQLGIFGYIITFLWLMGLTNAYNFMDGLNGMAAGPAVITGLFFCALSYSQGSIFVYIICYTLIAGALGFLVFNFPKPHLFMGDVGSSFLGFTFAALAIIASLYDHSHTSFFIVPLLLFNFIYDTSFTFVRRLMLRENVFSAHKTHLYQLFNRLGHSHIKVSLFHYVICITQGIGAYVLLNLRGDKRLFVFLPFLVFQILYSTIIVRKAKTAQLIP